MEHVAQQTEKNFQCRRSLGRFYRATSTERILVVEPTAPRGVDFVGSADDQIDVVVPRNAPVMSIRPDQCSTRHEIRRVDPFEGIGENDKSLPKDLDVGLGHRRDENDWTEKKLRMLNDSNMTQQTIMATVKTIFSIRGASDPNAT
jgi:hypothetical protein